MQKQIVLKATGESIFFTKTAADTNGAYVEAIVTLPAGGEGPPPHRHVFQSELFEAIENSLGIDVNGEKIVLSPGQSYTVPPNTIHQFHGMDGQPVKFRAVFTPALSIEYLLSEMFEACNRKQSKDPSPFDACYILRQAKGEYYLGNVPVLIQKTVFPMTARFGKLFGLVKARSKEKV